MVRYRGVFLRAALTRRAARAEPDDAAGVRAVEQLHHYTVAHMFDCGQGGAADRAQEVLMAGDLDTAVALHRAQGLMDARPGATLEDLRELLRMVVIVMALREFTPFARPMGDRGRPLDIAPDPYLPRPALVRARIPGPRRPRPEELRLRRR